MSPQEKSFLKSAAIYGVGALLQQVANILLVPIYTRFMSKQEFGLLEVVNRVGEVVVIALMIRGLRMATLTFYKQAENDVQRARTASTISMLVAIILPFIGGTLLLFGEPLAHFVHVQESDVLVFAILVAFLDGLLVVPLAVMQARIEPLHFIAVSIGLLLTKIALCVVLVVYYERGIWGVLIASAVSTGTFGVLLTLREWKRGSFHFNLAIIPAVMRYSLPFVPAGLCGFLLHSGDRFFLKQYDVPNDVIADYALAYRLVTAIALVSVTPLYQVWSSQMYDAAKRPDAAHRFGLMTARHLNAFLFVAMTMCVFKEEVIRILGGKKYEAAAAMIPPLAAAYYCFHASCLLDSAFYVTRSTVWKLPISIVGVIVTVGLYVLWIPTHGTWGAVFATLVGFISFAAVTWICSQYAFPSQYDYGRLLGMFLISAAAAAATYSLGLGVVPFLIKAAVWSAWPIVVWNCGLLGAEEKKLIRNAVEKVCSRLAIRFRPVSKPSELP